MQHIPLSPPQPSATVSSSPPTSKRLLPCLTTSTLSTPRWSKLRKPPIRLPSNREKSMAYLLRIYRYFTYRTFCRFSRKPLFPKHIPYYNNAKSNCGYPYNTHSHNLDLAIAKKRSQPGAYKQYEKNACQKEHDHTKQFARRHAHISPPLASLVAKLYALSLYFSSKQRPKKYTLGTLY